MENFPTPAELRATKTQRVQNLIDSALAHYKQMVTNRCPDEDGYYRVSLGGLNPYTEAEHKFAREQIELCLANSGWDFVMTHEMYGYRIRPKSEA